MSSSNQISDGRTSSGDGSSDSDITLEVSVYDVDDSLVWRDELLDQMEFGRQNTAGPQEEEPEPYELTVSEGGFPRLIIAEKTERKISRRQLQLAVVDGRLMVTNTSQVQPMVCNHSAFEPNGVREFDLHSVVRLEIGDRKIVIGPTSDSSSLRSLAEPTKRPGSGSKDRTPLKLDDLEQAAPETMMAWLSDMIDVLQSAASSENFLELAAQAVVEIVKLDNGMVLMRDPLRGWKCVAAAAAEGEPKSIQPSQIVLGRMLNDRKTYWLVPTPLEASQSLTGVTTVIASPILDSEGNVIAAIYGDRRAGPHPDSISDLEARMVEVLACAVASGMARVRHQEAALRTQVESAETRTLLEQFFSPSLAEQLLDKPDLLEGRDVEVTVMFCDLREFTAVSERLEPREMLRWVNAVQDAFSNCVINSHGVLVDYVGDELLAMWGAPAVQPNHATLACRAAGAIIRCLPQLDRRWSEKVGQSTAVGIGISTGMALVGNTGSTRKFKYGPLGRTVVVGSRVQDATRLLRSQILITQTTAEQLEEGIETRRVGRVRLPHLQAPEMLYEVAVDPDDDWRQLRDAYEQIMVCLEGRQFEQALKQLQEFRRRWPGDGPARLLERRTADLDLDESFGDLWVLQKPEDKAQ